MIQRQGFKRSVVAYLATVIGGLASMFIYPLAYDVYGEIRFVLSVALFLYPLVSLGVNSLPVRFFPEFEQGQQRNGFLGFLGLWLFIATSISGLCLYFNSGVFYEALNWFGYNVEPIQKHSLLIAGITVLMATAEMLKRYTANFKRVVVPEIITGTALKFFLPVLIFLIYYYPFLIKYLGRTLLIFYALTVLAGIGYLRGLGGLDWRIKFKFLDKERLWRIGNYALYGLIGSLGSVVAFNLDSIMVSSLLGYEANGEYTNALNFANFIIVPQLAISAIAGPIINQALYQKNMEGVKKLYQQSSLNLGLVGALVYILLIVNLKPLFTFSANEVGMQPLIYPIYILGLAKVIDMFCGLNREIMGYSQLYRWNLLFVLALGGLNIYLNDLLIPIYGISGAAMATFTSLVAINILRLFFLYFRLGIQPFTIKHIGFVLLSFGVGVLAIYISLPVAPLLIMLMKSSFVLLVILGGNYFFNWSPLVNEALLNVYQRIQSTILGK